MYKNITIATDGSKIADNAVGHAVALAKNLGATLTAVTVTEPYEAVAFTGTMTVVNPSEYNKQCEEHAEGVLSKACEKAKAASVPCDPVHLHNRLPYVGIIEAAENSNADLIVVGSHGRTGLEGFLLGSQSVKLLTHTKIPTLVVR
jgi:nucleotide-binding universal stress UspA family protein